MGRLNLIFILKNIFKLKIKLDTLRLNFITILLIISLTVWNFSLVYISNKQPKFQLWFWGFVFCMLLLIVSSDFITCLLGWDGLGLTSFILVSFYKSSDSWSGSLKTFLINRLGDGFFLIFLGLLLWLNKFLKIKNILLISSFLILGCFTKSAQFPFSLWLPAAMAAPTPVSALVHSSTLVTAGVYLLIRFKNSYEGLSCILLYFGCWTLLLGSLNAFYSRDSKKIIAFSTLSKLGFMVLILGLGYPLIRFLHLIRHACFKALLFICFGYLILQKKHNQKIYKNKGTKREMLFVIITVRILSKAGLCFFRGFFSKDLIILSNCFRLKVFILSCIFIKLFFTGLYSLRLFITVSLYNYTSKYSYNNLVPLFLLSLVKGKFYSYSLVYYKIKQLYTSSLIFLFIFLGFTFTFFYFYFGGLVKINIYYFNFLYLIKSTYWLYFFFLIQTKISKWDNYWLNYLRKSLKVSKTKISKNPSLFFKLISNINLFIIFLLLLSGLVLTMIL